MKTLAYKIKPIGAAMWAILFRNVARSLFCIFFAVDGLLLCLHGEPRDALWRLALAVVICPAWDKE